MTWTGEVADEEVDETVDGDTTRVAAAAAAAAAVVGDVVERRDAKDSAVDVDKCWVVTTWCGWWCGEV